MSITEGPTERCECGQGFHFPENLAAHKGACQWPKLIAERDALKLQVRALEEELKEKREERQLWIAQKFRPPGDAETKLAAANRLNGELRLAGQRARGQLREVLTLGMFAPESSAHVYAAHEALEAFDTPLKRNCGCTTMTTAKSDRCPKCNTRESEPISRKCPYCATLTNDAARLLCPTPCIDCCCNEHHWGDYSPDEDESGEDFESTMQCKHCDAKLDYAEPCTICGKELIDHELDSFQCDPEDDTPMPATFTYVGKPYRLCNNVHPWDKGQDDSQERKETE